MPWEEATLSGELLGLKLVLNEFVAFVSFGEAIKHLSEKTIAVMTFALCGFANFSVIGILLGGLGSMVPSRRGEIAKLGIRALLAATLANLLSGAVVGAFF